MATTLDLAWLEAALLDFDTPLFQVTDGAYVGLDTATTYTFHYAMNDLPTVAGNHLWGVLPVRGYAVVQYSAQWLVVCSECFGKFADPRIAGVSAYHHSGCAQLGVRAHFQTREEAVMYMALAPVVRCVNVL
jgi:hypothetical protein